MAKYGYDPRIARYGPRDFHRQGNEVRRQYIWGVREIVNQIPEASALAEVLLDGYRQIVPDSFDANCVEMYHDFLRELHKIVSKERIDKATAHVEAMMLLGMHEQVKPGKKMTEKQMLEKKNRILSRLEDRFGLDIVRDIESLIDLMITIDKEEEASRKLEY